jgi:hypothetical protein
MRDIIILGYMITFNIIELLFTSIFIFIFLLQKK